MNKKLGIIVSGGPAPGINNVIAAAVREASHLNIDVVGFNRGFLGITEQGSKALQPLSTETTVAIRMTGGSQLRTSRFNPFSNKLTEQKFLSELHANQIDKLIIIGGDGSAYITHHMATHVPEISVVHVPKTIDNDLILPQQHPSFGFETARSVGTEVVKTLMVDAKTVGGWFVVITMGRKAGFLALGLGIASGAHLTIIPEEFADTAPTVNQISETIVSTIVRRYQHGKDHGVVLIAEGVLDKIDPKGVPLLEACPRDELGRIKYSDIELGDILLPTIRSACIEKGLDPRIKTKNIGYELRCQPPLSFDLEYTTFIGFGAVRLLSEGKSGVMVTKEFDKLGSVPLSTMVDTNGKIMSRKVDIESDLYKVARTFMDR